MTATKTTATKAFPGIPRTFPLNSLGQAEDNPENHPTLKLIQSAIFARAAKMTFFREKIIFEPKTRCTQGLATAALQNRCFAYFSVRGLGSGLFRSISWRAARHLSHDREGDSPPLPHSPLAASPHRPPRLIPRTRPRPRSPPVPNPRSHNSITSHRTAALILIFFVPERVFVSSIFDGPFL